MGFSRINGESLNIVLCGFMASGKTTVGRALAERLDRRFLDIDSLVEEESGMAVTEIFERDGETAFRELERAAIARYSGRSGLVIALGGGAVLDSRNTGAVRRNGVVYWLKVSPGDVVSRADTSGGRPLLPGGIAEIGELLMSREEAYALAADVIVETGGKSAAEVAREVLEDFRGRREDGKVHDR